MPNDHSHCRCHLFRVALAPLVERAKWFDAMKMCRLWRAILVFISLVCLILTPSSSISVSAQPTFQVASFIYLPLLMRSQATPFGAETGLVWMADPIVSD